MSNLEVVCIVAALWFLTGRGINLCFVILLYYALYIAYPLLPELSIAMVALGEAQAIYASQLSFDTIALVLTLALSNIYHKSIRIYLVYGAIIATSAMLNASMLFGVTVGCEELYYIHALRQEISAPLDVLFAVLGSGKGGQFTDYFSRSLLSVGRSVYNRINRFSNHFKGA
jgi:hypothetical protein